MRGWLTLVFVAGMATAAFSQITLGLTSNFQNGNAEGWGGSGAQFVANGGPNGAGDGYMDVFSNSSNPPHLAMYNFDQWTGNYLAAGVTGIRLQLANLSTASLQMRIVVFTATTRFTSVNAVAVGPNAGWSTMEFSLASADLTRVQGTQSYTDVMSAVTRIMVRHDSSPPSSGGSTITARVGIDNIQAVPEPTSMAALGLGALALLRRRRRA